MSLSGLVCVLLSGNLLVLLMAPTSQALADVIRCIPFTMLSRLTGGGAAAEGEGAASGGLWGHGGGRRL